MRENTGCQKDTGSSGLPAVYRDSKAGVWMDRGNIAQALLEAVFYNPDEIGRESFHEGVVVGSAGVSRRGEV